MGADDVITHVEPPKSREQLALLLMRWNALRKLGVDASPGNPEMHHLTVMLRNIARQQHEFEERKQQLAAARRERAPDSEDSLKAQISAFKLLSRGIDIPEHIRTDLVAAIPQQGDQAAETDVPATTDGSEVLAPRKPVPEAGLTIEEREARILGSRRAVPDVEIRNRLAHRVVELERLSSNIGTINAHNADLMAPDELAPDTDELKFQALIELKGLRLLTKQKSLRQHAIYNYATGESAFLGSSQLLRGMNRRIKASAAQELQLTAELERRQRHEREQQARHSQIELTKAALKRAGQFKQQREQQRARKTAFIKHVTQFHSQVEREESRRAERTARQRLQALRSNDEEAYIKLLDQTKDTRITHLLKQTNQFLASLSEAVRVQQAEAGAAAPPTEEELEKIDYYEVAHRVKEPVTKQASILVGGELKEYQIRGLEWMISLVNNNLNGILADEMGLGKTIQTISLITYLIEAKRWTGPFLVIVPLSTITNWTVEFDKWAPSVRKVVYKGPPNARKAQQAIVRSGDFQVLLTTYEYVIKDRLLLSKIRWQHMIIDEGHRMKNTQSKLSYTLVNHYYSRHRLILTGTPLQNNLPELWALLNFVLPKIFNSQKTFDEWFNTPFANTGGQDKMELTEEETLLVIRRLHKVLRPFLLRRLKKDVEKDLPDKVERVIKCKMSSLQQILYEQMLKYGLIYTGPNETTNGSSKSGGGSGLRSLNNRIMQLRKICNHPYVFKEVEDTVDSSHLQFNLLWRTAGKFELLDRILPKFRATGHRVLIFFQMTSVMDIMEDYLRYRGLKYLRLDGMTRAEDRSAKLKEFNAENSEYFCFLLSTRAGGLGLNLQSADTVIIYDTDWNPFQDLQAQDRAHRIGQTKEVRILRLITEHTIEEAILDRALSKLEIDGKVIQAGKFDNKSTNEEQEAFLRSLIEAEEARREQKDQGEEEIDNEELNQILARTEDELTTFHNLDGEREAEDSKRPVPRLFSYGELPNVYKEDLGKVMSGQAYEELGTRRERRRILFDEDSVEEESEEDSKPSRRTPKRSASPAFANGSSDKKRKVNAEDTEALVARANRLLDDIMEQTADDPPHSRAAIFLELPSRSDYPDYYKIIRKPISLAEIRSKLDAGTYSTFAEFKADLIQMFNNARTYNREGSEVYEDANVLEKLVNEAAAAQQ